MIETLNNPQVKKDYRKVQNPYTAEQLEKMKARAYAVFEDAQKSLANILRKDRSTINKAFSGKSHTTARKIESIIESYEQRKEKAA